MHRRSEVSPEMKQKRQKSYNKPKIQMVTKKKKCVNSPKRWISSFAATLRKSGRSYDSGIFSQRGAELQASSGPDEQKQNMQIKSERLHSRPPGAITWALLFWVRQEWEEPWRRPLTSAAVLHCPEQTLTLSDRETDKLLNAFPILLLCGAAGGVLTWLSQRSLRLLHLLVHPGQTQPDGQSRQTGGQSGRTSTFAELLDANAQRDDVGVGLLDRHAQRVLAVLVFVALRRSSFQE